MFSLFTHKPCSHLSESLHTSQARSHMGFLNSMCVDWELRHELHCPYANKSVSKQITSFVGLSPFKQWLAEIALPVYVHLRRYTCLGGRVV